MSDKSKLLQNDRDAIEKLESQFQLKKAILDAMDGIECPVSIGAFGYCADVSLFYKKPTSVHELFKAMPPIPLAFIKGSTVTIKPEEFVRESDHGWRRKIFPVIMNAGNPSSIEEGLVKVSWWTKISGKSVSIDAECRVADIISLMGADVERYSPDSYSYSTGTTGYFALRHKSADDIKISTPMEKWHETWKSWIDSHDWNAKQKNFVNVFHSWSEYSESELAIPVADSHPGVWARMGDMRLSFTQEELDEILTFSKARQFEVKQAIEVAESYLPVAEVWLREFFTSRGNPFNYHGYQRVEIRADAFEYFKYLFRKETGLPGIINWVSHKGENKVEVGYTVDKAHIRVECEFLKDAPALDWDSIIEYR